MPNLQDKRARKRAFISLTQGSNSVRSICETFRLIYDLVYNIEDQSLKEEITERLVDAMMMSKAMNDRLIYYKDTYNDTTGKAGKGVEHLGETEKRKNYRRSRV